MAYDQKKLERFQKTIMDEADEQIDKIEKETSEYEKTELDKARQLEYDKIFATMQQRVRDIQWKYKRELTHKHLESIRRCLNLRNNLVEQLFGECEQKLKEFSSSDEYVEFLVKKANEAASGFDCDSAEFLLREQDIKYFEDLSKITGIKKYSADKTNSLGGFKIVNKKAGLLLDLTIEDKLKAERRRFYETSKFSVDAS